VLLTAVLVLLLIPFAAAFGTATHTRLQHQTQAMRAGVHQIPAVLLEDTHPAPETTEYSPRATGNRDSARVRWSTPDGQRTAAVPTDAPAKAGQAITISVGADGNLTGPIPSNRENTIVAATTACGAWALAAGALLLPRHSHTRSSTETACGTGPANGINSTYHCDDPRTGSADPVLPAARAHPTPATTITAPRRTLPPPTVSGRSPAWVVIVSAREPRPAAAQHDVAVLRLMGRVRRHPRRRRPDAPRRPRNPRRTRPQSGLGDWRVGVTLSPVATPGGELIVVVVGPFERRRPS